MIVIKTPQDLERMRVACQITAHVCKQVAACVSPGMTTKELDGYADGLIRENGAVSAFLGYKGFPGHICVSINEGVVHGVPGSRRIQMGDIVSLDIGVVHAGFVGDMATTVMVGVTDSMVIRLVAVTEQSLQAGIEKAKVGNRVSDISHAIEQTAVGAGFSVVREFVGHGIGRSMHEDPQIPNFGLPGRGAVLKKGMTLAIEPMINLGRPEVEILGDGWTVVTRDRTPSAHFEHTIVVQETGPEILTRAQ